QLGYMPESAPVEPGLTVKAYLKFRAKIKGEQSRRIRHRVLEAISTCGLDELGDVSIEHLSNGQRRRVALADALLLRPRYLLLDDLFAGIDTGTRASLGQTLASFAQFASIIVSGHELEELARCTSRFIVLKDGRAVEAKGLQGVREVMSR
ncbi:MAG: ATP-binding cassette domain-containing protein, partial [Pyramidobacter sp.]|nr:ATP-binding cassette domain-containing protein [Pyramidobacter sp.]